MKPRIILWIYLTCCLANLVAQVMPSDELNRYTKPLLMPLLLFYVYRQSVGNTTAKVLLLSVALLFSWLGDVVLIYKNSDMYFLIGIALFLIAQITYVFVLRRSTLNAPKVRLQTLLPFIAYGAALFYILLPAGDFSAPIVVYGIVIMIMAVTAYARKGLTTDESFRLAFIGSVLFVLSDSILAINAFTSPVPYSGLFIMATYCAAQYLLVVGLLKHPD